LHYALRSKKLSVDLLNTLIGTAQGRSKLFGTLNIRVSGKIIIIKLLTDLVTFK